MIRKRSVTNFTCDYDGNPMRVSSDSHGLTFAINDEGENNQSKQVRLDDHDAARLLHLLTMHVCKYSEKEDALARLLSIAYDAAKTQRETNIVAKCERILRRAFFGKP